MNLFVLMIILTIIFAVIISKIRVAQEYQRFAVFNNIGQYEGLKGPGLFWKWSGNGIKWFRVAVGDKGELIGFNVAKFEDTNIPTICDGKTPIGSVIRVVSFADDKVQVVLEPNQERTAICEKCGHEMVV